MIVIHEPEWHKDTSKRCVGLAEFRLRAESLTTTVKITYRNKETGKLSYPNLFKIQTSKCFKYPVRWVGHGNVKVYIVPIEDMKEVGVEKNTTQQGDKSPKKDTSQKQEHQTTMF